jgi:serine/threonine protein kinase/formylglycine-generating enzyme required for sulfatase activity
MASPEKGGSKVCQRGVIYISSKALYRKPREPRLPPGHGLPGGRRIRYTPGVTSALGEHVSRELKDRFLRALRSADITPAQRNALEFLFNEALQVNPLATLAELTSESTISVNDTEPLLGSDDEDWFSDAAGLQPKPLDLPERYWSLGLIGAGSMGEVYRTYDRALRRVLAMKVLRADLKHPELAVVRFVEEAQITAQLEHPGIVPVHDIGQLPDGRWYFTSKEAKGRTLTEIIREVHAQRLEKGTFGNTETGWTFRRLIDAFHKVCVAVAYAHARGVIHRDIKPDNILVGNYGEVLVLDWGLARPLGGTTGEASASDGRQLVDSDRAEDPKLATRDGLVAGTPAFMAPEQARGVPDLTPACDVYALGGVLYMIIFGHHPYEEMGAREVLRLVREGPPPFPPAPWAPLHLITICRKALSKEHGDRYADASSLAAEIDAWVEGARNRERSQAMVQAVRGRVSSLTKRYLEAVRRRERARRSIQRLPPTATLADKEASWAEEDQSEHLLDDVEDAFQDVVQQLRAALLQCPDLLEGRAALADLYRSRYETAMALGQPGRARGFERLVQEYDIGHHAAFLQRRGRLTIHTDPPDAMVEVYRFETRARRLEREPTEVLGPTPIDGANVAAGSYLLVLRAPGRPLVSYPVHIEREGHWNSSPPGAKRTKPVRVLSEGLVPRSMIYIPEGWATYGGDPNARGSSPRQRLWHYPYFIGRNPVTHLEYLAFLDALLAAGDQEQALDRVPSVRVPRSPEPVSLYQLSPSGQRFVPSEDTPLGPLRMDAPVSLVRWHDAAAYCLWLQARDKLPWRLPSELEREKAGRGVDGRPFPWGSHSDPTFHCTQDSHLEYPAPPASDGFPIDTSPYGVRGLAGGVADWCQDEFRHRGAPHRGAVVNEPPPLVAGDDEVSARPVRRSVRGGSFDGAAQNGRCAARNGQSAIRRKVGLGFRLGFSLQELLDAKGKG